MKGNSRFSCPLRLVLAIAAFVIVPGCFRTFGALDVGADGSSRHDAISEGNFRRIDFGMTHSQVVAILGRDGESVPQGSPMGPRTLQWVDELAMIVVEFSPGGKVERMQYFPILPVRIGSSLTKLDLAVFDGNDVPSR